MKPKIPIMRGMKIKKLLLKVMKKQMKKRKKRKNLEMKL